MTTENEHVPAPSMLEAFTRDPRSISGVALSYLNLQASSEDAARNEYSYLGGFLKAPLDSLVEEERARAAATAYLIRYGARLRSARADRRQLIADRMTALSIELYGEPRAAEVERIATQEYRYFTALRDDEAVDQNMLESIVPYYEPAVARSNHYSSIGEEFRDVAKEWADLLWKRHQKALTYLKETAATKPRFAPSEAADLFRQALKFDSEDNKLYAGISVEVNGGTSMAYNEVKNIVTVGGSAKEIPANRLMVLYAHEVLGHATRNLNGRKFDDVLVREGLPNYVVAEEGVTMLSSFAIGEEISTNILDHYFNSALALGKVNGRQIPRFELHRLQTARGIVRAQALGEEVSYEAVAQKAWGIINRIYRGSPGDEVVAVSTKDICYYDGFLRIGEFVKAQAEAGVAVADIMDFLMMARFDPTNKRHVDYLRSLDK